MTHPRTGDPAADGTLYEPETMQPVSLLAKADPNKCPVCGGPTMVYGGLCSLQCQARVRSTPVEQCDRDAAGCRNCRGFGYYLVEESEERIVCGRCNGTGSSAARPAAAEGEDANG